MKLIFAILGLVAAMTVQAEECPQRTAQFFGSIASVRTERIDQGVFDCYVKLNYSEVKPAGICPLHIGTVQEIYVGPFPCEGEVEVGQKVDGILVQDDQSGFTYWER